MFRFRTQQEDRPSENGHLRVFISYSREDELIADRFVGGLVRRGIKVMIDRSDLMPGYDWREELKKMIQAADTVICLVSEDSIDSEEVKWELKTAKSLNKRLVPVQIDEINFDKLPPTINELQQLSLLPSDDFEKRLDELAHTLKVPQAWLQTHTWLGDQARRGIRLRGKVLKDAKRWLREKPIEAEPPTQDILDHIVYSRRIANQLRYLTIASTIGMLIIIAVGLKWYDDSRKAAQTETLIAQSMTLAARSEQETERGHAAYGINLALQGLPDPKAGRMRPVVIEAQRALYKAFSSLRERVVFEGHNNALTHAEMNPMGDRVVTTSTDGLAGLWAIDGRLLRWLGGHIEPVNMARFSPNGERVVNDFG